MAVISNMMLIFCGRQSVLHYVELMVLEFDWNPTMHDFYTRTL